MIIHQWYITFTFYAYLVIVCQVYFIDLTLSLNLLVILYICFCRFYLLETQVGMAPLFDTDDGYPSSIWCMILSFLDCLDVVRLSLLSKNWYHSIRSSEFVKFYSEFGPRASGNIIIQGQSPLSIKNDKTRILISQDLQDYPLQTILVPHSEIGSKHEYELVGSARGVICLQMWDQDNRCVFVMVNPLTGQMYQSISPARRTSHGKY